MPISAAMSPSGLSDAAWAIRRSAGRTFRRSSLISGCDGSAGRKAHSAVAASAPNGKKWAAASRLRGVGRDRGRQVEQGVLGLVGGGGRELEHAAGLLAQHLQRRPDAAGQAELEQLGRGGDAGQADADGQRVAHRPQPPLPRHDRLGRERELGDQVHVEAAVAGDAVLRGQRPRQHVVGDVGMPLRVARDADAADARLLEAAGVEDLRRLVELADRVAMPPAMSSTSSTPTAASSPSMRPQGGAVGHRRGPRCAAPGASRRRATHRDRARVCSHGTFGRNVR